MESVLGFDQAFFGLLASGWGLGDFASHAALPTQARWAESIVGLLDLERAQPECYEPSQFAEMLAASLEGQRVEPFRPLTANELRLVRDLRDDLWRRWLEVPPGGTLSIPFPLVTPESGVSNARPA